MLKNTQKKIVQQEGELKMRKLFFYSALALLLLINVTSGWATKERLYLQSLCANPLITCIHAQRGESWKKLFPDPDLRLMVMKLNRINESLHPGLVIAVPKNLQSATLMDFSPFDKQIPSIGEKLLIYNPKINAWAAYDASGALMQWGPGSSGADWCPDLGRACHTPAGSFRVYGKGGADCESSIFPMPYGGAPMSYCMYFVGGDAFHASDEVPGYNASHGCVRIFYDDAKWLNLQFVDLPNQSNDHKGTRVIIMPYY